MLKELHEYAVREGLAAEPGFAAKTVRWGLSVTKGGEFGGLVEFGDAGARRNRGRLFRMCPEFSQGELIAGGETRGHFLWESAGVVALLLKGEPGKRELAKHRYFVSLLEKAGGDIPDLKLCADLLASEAGLALVRTALQQVKAKPADSVTFVVSGKCLLDGADWHEWWRAFRRTVKGDTSSGGTSSSRCLLSGELVKPAETHPPIRGLSDVGGQPGCLLISFDKDAFSSYGLEQSLNAAVGEEAAASYRAALNDLIQKTGVRFGGTKMVHWFEKAVELENDPLAFLTMPEKVLKAEAKETACQVLASIRTGVRAELGANRFYLMAVSGSGGRVMVRDWLDGSFEELAERIELWFLDLNIVRPDGDGSAPDKGLWAIADGCLKPKKKGEKPDEARDLELRRVADRLLRSAIHCEPIPDSIGWQILFRFRAEMAGEKSGEGKTRPAHTSTRMGLLKAFLLRRRREKGANEMVEETKRAMQEISSDPAYHCGQLMALLAAVQRRALGDVGAGVVQRYYAAASTTPSLVFGRLVRTAQFHLGKLEPGLARWYDSKIAEVTGHFGDRMPKTLDLEGQSFFALGYYQQIAELRKTKRGFDEESAEETNNGESN